MHMPNPMVVLEAELATGSGALAIAMACAGTRRVEMRRTDARAILMAVLSWESWCSGSGDACPFG